MSNLYQNTLQGFLQESVRSGEIHLLISGTLGDIGITSTETGYTWDTGSWKQNQVDATGSWVSTGYVGKNTGSIQPGMYLTGLAISAYVSGSRTTELAALQKATRLIMTVSFGSGSNSRQTLDLNVKSRQLQNGYIFLEVDKTPLPLGPVFDVYFKYSGSNNYRGYSAYYPEGPEIDISLLPFTQPADFSDYDPIYNNAIENTEGTIARLVEPFELHNLLVRSANDIWDTYNGQASSWSLSDPSQSINGVSASWSASDPVKTAQGGGVLGTYRLLPSVYVEKATGLACIPDSFYTSIANISGRWLGTKNAEYHTYLGKKLEFTEKNIEECEQDIQQNVDKGVYLTYQGSPYVLDTQNPVETDFTGNIKGTAYIGSKLSGSLEGTINGYLSGSVTGVNIDSQLIEYYSSSVNVIDHEIWTNVSRNITGTGTLEYARWLRYESPMVYEIVAEGANILWGGMTRFSGQCGQDLIPSAKVVGTVPTITLTCTGVSGSVTTRGSITGSGQVNYTASQQVAESLSNTKVLATSLAMLSSEAPAAVAKQVTTAEKQTIRYTDPNLLYIQNANISRLIVDDITYGDLKVISSGSVYISGTVGNVADTFTLHKFTGKLSIDNGMSQDIAFEHADADGVVMSDVEVAEGSTTTFDSFTANSITTVQDFSGRAGFALTEGTINVASDGTMYISLTTEDQEDITGSGATGSDASGTGSLPSAISKFMSPATGDYGERLVPVWDFSTFRKNIVGDMIGGVVRERDMLAKGTALVSGSFQDFEVQATRKNLRLYKNLPISGSNVRQTDVLQATRMLSSLEAGLTFARQAYLRSDASIETSSVTPRIVSKAVMPQRVFDAMITASRYVVPDTDGDPVWKLSGNLPSGGLDRNFDFYATGSGAKQQIQNFMTGSKNAIDRLSTFLSGSVLDSYAKKQSGQYTYVYLSSIGSDFLRADIRHFTGSYIDLTNDTIHHTSGFQALSGSFRQIWGKFGEGTIVRGQVLKSISVEPAVTEKWPISSLATLKRKASGIQGVIYGAFDFKGYVDGGYEGNMVEGTIEGDLSGVLSGLVSTGSIEGGPVQIIGTNRGAFNGTVKAGTFKGALKNLSVAGNKLTDNLHFEGQIEGVEEFPLDGLLSGSVKTVTLPGQCTYNVTASRYTAGNRMNIHVPQKGSFTGQIINVLPIGWTTSSIDNVLEADLVGKNIDLETVRLISTISGSVSFGGSGSLTLQEDIGWDNFDPNDTKKYLSKLSGQFEIGGGSIKVTTPGNNPFSGKIATVLVDQPVSGNFDVTVQKENASIGLDMTGSLENFTGHVLTKGLLDIKSGVDGNLVEGHDRPFFTLQSFSGSIFPEDTTPEAVLNMNISDMTMESLGFTSGMALVKYSSGSFGEVKEQEYIQNTLTLPQIGDIIYTSIEGKTRVVSSKLYCPDLNTLLTVNDRGTVVAGINLAQVQ